MLETWRVPAVWHGMLAATLSWLVLLISGQRWGHTANTAFSDVGHSLRGQLARGCHTRRISRLVARSGQLPAASGSPFSEDGSRTGRRGLAVVLALALAALARKPWLGTSGILAQAKVMQAKAKALVVPLFWRAGGFCLRYQEARRSASDKAPEASVFWGVVDTGSPFLLLGRCLRPDCESYCRSWGCFSGEGKPVGLDDTIEVYVSGQRSMEWRGGLALQFPDAWSLNLNLEDLDRREPEKRGEAKILPDLTFGVQGASEGTGGTGGGVYFGLIRDHAPDIRPSFLEQTPYKSLQIDLRRPKLEVLTLVPDSLLAGKIRTTAAKAGIRGDVVELLDARCFGGPVRHYAAVASNMTVGGVPLQRRVLCIFDTGTTGVALTDGAFQFYFATLRQRARQLGSLASARKLNVSFPLRSGKELTLSMYTGRHPVYGEGLDLVTAIPEVAWTGVGDPISIEGYVAPQETGCNGPQIDPWERFDEVAFLGLGFFVGKCLTIDAEAGLLSVSADSEEAAGRHVT